MNQVQKGRDFLVMEHGYIDRENHVSLGFNGLNGTAEFLNSDVPPDRGDKFRHLLKPFRFGEYTLIAGQVPGDASLEGVDIERWAEKVAETARQKAEKPVYYRPHPVAPTSPDLPIGGSLDGAHWVITHSSNLAVEAVLEGVPTVATGNCSMVKDICPREVRYEVLTGRDKWLDRIAYAQWTWAEIEKGDAWEHLGRKYA